MSTKYYDGTKLLSMRDIDGNKPEIYMCTTNRTGGKTTYFSRFLVNRFKKRGEKFAILYRFKYELDSIADKFFKDIGGLFFKDDVMTSESCMGGIYHELYLNGVHCGYALSINSADQIKRNSHLFNDISWLLFDEFQSETNHYCDNEIKKLISIHTSVARGQGEQVKYVPIIMIANPVSIINPYYVELGISNRLRTETKFLKGTGFVLEQGYVESASKAQKESGFNKAFSKNAYVSYSSESTYLNDNIAFIERPTGESRYIATLKYDNCEYGIREFLESGIIYCDDKPDTTSRYKLTVDTSDHEINYVMLQRNSLFIQNMRYLFEKGCFRFKNLRCKEVILTALSY